MPTDKTRSAAPASPGDFTAFGAGLPSAAGISAMQAWMEIGAEAVRFASDRLQQDIKTQKAMLACTSLDQMRTVQTEFFKSAQEQYAAEARRMMDLMAKAANAGLTRPDDRRKYDDVPL